MIYKTFAKVCNKLVEIYDKNNYVTKFIFTIQISLLGTTISLMIMQKIITTG